MNPRLFVAILSTLVFASGLAGGMWIERHRPLPAPPVRLGIEFAHGDWAREHGGRREHPLNRGELIARVEALRPELESFRSRLDQIDSEFDQGMNALLTPDQREHRTQYKTRKEKEQPATDGPPLTDVQIIELLREQPAKTILWDVVIPFRLDFLTQVYGLDDPQQEKVRLLLQARREKILQLVDSSPPPSVILFRLAPLVQRLESQPQNPR